MFLAVTFTKLFEASLSVSKVFSETIEYTICIRCHTLESAYSNNKIVLSRLASKLLLHYTIKSCCPWMKNEMRYEGIMKSESWEDEQKREK